MISQRFTLFSFLNHVQSKNNFLRQNTFQLIGLNFSSTAEAEILNLFHNNGPPNYDQVVSPVPGKEAKIFSSKKDPIINCKRPEFNHYKNQKYSNIDSIPLACKGWGHYKSKGDSFTIHINKEHCNDTFWSSTCESFADLKLSSDIVDAVNSIGLRKPTQIQEETIPIILSGKNTVVAAETGCGKTLAYLLPLIEQIIQWKKLSNKREFNSPLGLVICPNRELALQIGKIAKQLSHQLPFSCDTIIGGRTKRKMTDPSFKEVDLQIATLGVLSKLTTTGLLNVREVRHLVLDEADTLLDDSFSDLLIRFMNKVPLGYVTVPSAHLPSSSQLSLVSATMPRDIDTLLNGIIETESLVRVASNKLHRVLSHVPQTFYRLGNSEKAAKLLKIAKTAVSEKIPTLIFSNKSATSDWISLMLHENGVPSLNLNGDMPLEIRMDKFNEFKNGASMILSSTDICSRGLDTNHVQQIINYDFPLYMADYIHRCGRTGRCGSPTSCRISHFISTPREIELVKKIELAVRTMNDLPNVNGNIRRIIERRINNSGNHYISK